MKTFFRSIVALTLFGCAIWAADVTQNPSDPRAYFYYVFMSLTNPDRPAEASYFEDAYARMHHLSDADIATLRAGAEEFRAAGAKARAEASLGSRDEDGQATHARNMAFLSQVADIGNRFLAQLSPEAARRVRIAMGPASSPTPEAANAGGPAGHTSPAVGKASHRAGKLSPRDLALPSSFTTCISASGTGSTCTLPAGTYDVNGSATYPVILVQRSNVTIEGSAVPGSPTILKRTVNGSTWPQSIAEVQQNNQNVTFSYLTFEGSSPSMPLESYNGTYFDLDLQEGGFTGEYVWNTYVSNCTFQDQPKIAVYTNYYSYINGNWFYFNTNTLYNGTAAIWTENDLGAKQSTNVQFVNNTVQNSGGGATGITGSSVVLIQGNTISGSNLGCKFSNGGEIGVVQGPSLPDDYVPNDIVVSANHVNGLNVPCSVGTEFWGTDYQITGNTFINHPQDGIFTWNVSGATISGNTITNNGTDGIDMRDCGTLTGCPSQLCPPGANPLFTITDNIIENNGSYAILGVANGCVPPTYQSDQAPNANDVALSGNTISGNGNNTPYYH